MTKMTSAANFDEHSFVTQCGLDIEKWNSLGEEKIHLYNIYQDFKNNNEQFIEIAVSLSRLIQKMPGVHSVRWRIKDPGHLIKKIFRKKEACVEKYKNISVENYRDIVTDLIGIRALHLFKGDFPNLHRSIIETWDLDEEPAAYVRKGDTEELRSLYRDLELHVEEHLDGYRSIHYIIETNFTKRTVKCELQVRTIFEEGWSEIDHRIRYPDFSDDPLIRDFLHIFNRLSGAADEMGTFVDRLSTELASMNREQEEAKSRASEIEKQLDEKLQKLETLSSANTSMGSEIKELKRLLSVRQSELSRSPTGITIKASDIAAFGVLAGSDPGSRSDTLRSLNISPSTFKAAVNASKIISRRNASQLNVSTKRKSNNGDDD
jgi:ppGpp synthetase/RelA/SpoT-type nucleotidyltranferase